MNEFVTEIDEALKAHGAWRVRLREAALNEEATLPVAKICADDQCRLGKWLAQVDPGAPGAAEHLAQLRSQHTAFHKEAGRIAGMIAKGSFAEALTATDAIGYQMRAADLTHTLNDWRRAVS